MDLFLFIDTYYNMKFPKEEFWYFHIGLGLAFILINRMFINEDIYYFDLFIFIFPVMGFGGLLFIELIPKLDTDYHVIEESSDFKTYLKDHRELDFINLSVELGTMSAYDILATGSPEEKKRFLINFDAPDEKFKVEVLEKALLDEDTDVIHYAATELNSMYEKHRLEIQEAVKNGDLKDVFKSYKSYIRSGLLKGEVLMIYQKKALSVLKTLFEKNREYALELLELYRDMGDEEQCQKYLGKLLAEEEPDTKIVNFALKYYYEKNWYLKIIQLKDQILKSGYEIPYHLKNNIKGV